MANNYIKFYTFFDILKKHTNKENMISMKNILQMMEEKTGDRIDRRTIYEYIKTLKELGFDISDYSENKKGYYYKGSAVYRTLEESEIYSEVSQINVLIEFDNDIKEDVFQVLNDTKILKYGRENFLVSLKCDYGEDFIRWILQFGSKALVIEPIELRMAVKREIDKLQLLYA